MYVRAFALRTLAVQCSCTYTACEIWWPGDAASTGWNNEDRRTLLGIWGAVEVQNQLVRNKATYEKIAVSLSEVGYERTWQQCKTKIKHMVQRYKKVGY